MYNKAFYVILLFFLICDIYSVEFTVISRSLPSYWVDNYYSVILWYFYPRDGIGYSHRGYEYHINYGRVYPNWYYYYTYNKVFPLSYLPSVWTNKMCVYYINPSYVHYACGVVLKDNQDLEITKGGSFSVGAFVYFTNLPANIYQYVVSRGMSDSFGSTSAGWVMLKAHNTIYFRYAITDGSATFDYTDNTVPIYVGRWYFVGMVLSNNSVRLYVNGRRVYSATTTATNWTDLGNAPIVLGHQGKSGYERSVQGYVGAFFYSTNAFSDTMISNFYYNAVVPSSCLIFCNFLTNYPGLGVDRGKDSNQTRYYVVTAYGTVFPTYYTNYKYPYYYFDGVDDYLTVYRLGGAYANFNFTNYSKGTLNFWLRMYKNNPSLYYYYFSLRDFSDSNVNRAGFRKESNNKLTFYISNIYMIKTVNTFTDTNNWYMFTFVQRGDNTGIKFYVNGDEVSVTEDVTTDRNAWFHKLSGCTTLNLGCLRGNSTAYYANMAIARFSLYTNCLSSSEVKKLYRDTNIFSGNERWVRSYDGYF